jgi:tetratricopeptide (TPR) repeat protein
LFGKRSISGRIGTIAAGILLLTCGSLGAQTTDTQNLPGWVLYEKGLALYEQGHLSEALDLISLSARDGILTPEATYWIGRIYEAEGDYLLAEKRYKEALEDARFLYIPDDKWNIYYSIANIYLNKKEFDQYEQLLLSVFDQEMKRNTEIIRREHSYIQLLKSDGLDKLLLLYRLKLTYSLEATSRLGRYYNGKGLWKSSLIKNLYPLLTIFSSGIESLISRYPDFSFPVNMEEAWESDEEFLISLYEEYCSLSQSDFVFARDLKTFKPLHLTEDRLSAEMIINKAYPSFMMTPSVYTLLKMENHLGKDSFLKMETLYSALYFLGEALYQEGNPERALEFWSLLNMSSFSSSWKKLAAQKIKNPEEETPFLKY